VGGGGGGGLSHGCGRRWHDGRARRATFACLRTYYRMDMLVDVLLCLCLGLCVLTALSRWLGRGVLVGMEHGWGWG
jgi:hypothetical protein